MGFSYFSSVFTFFTLLLLITTASAETDSTTLSVLLAIKASLDPPDLILSSWSPNATEPCNSSFAGIACNENGQVVNISYFSSVFTFFTLLLLITTASAETDSTTLSVLLAIKASLDPPDLILSSWSPNATEPCNSSFAGIACNENGQVVNISLQGKELSGKIPPEIGLLKSLSGLYLHFNQLHGGVPKEIANLTQLSDLYLNVNNLSGEIPPELGNMSSLQVAAKL